MRLALVALVLLLSGCAGNTGVVAPAHEPSIEPAEAARPAGSLASDAPEPGTNTTAREPEPAAAAGPDPNATGPEEPPVPPEPPAPQPLPDLLRVRWSTQEILTNETLRFLLDPLGNNECHVIINTSEQTIGPGPSGISYIRFGGGQGIGWSGSGAAARAHAGNIDTNTILAPPGIQPGYSGHNSSWQGPLSKPAEVIVASHRFTPWPEGHPEFYGIGDQSVLFYYKCTGLARLTVEVGDDPAMWNEDNLSGGVGGTANVLLVRPFVEVADAVKTVQAGQHGTVLGVLLVDNAAHVELATPQTTASWTMAPLSGVERVDDTAGSYSLTVDAVGTGVLSGIILAAVSTTPTTFEELGGTLT